MKDVQRKRKELLVKKKPRVPKKSALTDAQFKHNRHSIIIIQKNGNASSMKFQRSHHSSIYNINKIND